MPEGEVFTVQEVADYLRVSVDAIWAAIRSGQLRAAKVGRAYRIMRADLEEYLQPQAVITK